MTNTTAHVTMYANITSHWFGILLNGVEECIVTQSTGDSAGNESEGMLSDDLEIVVANFKAMVFIPMCFFIGLPTNALNVVIFIKYGLHYRTNVCLFTLSLVDLLYEILIFFMYMEQMWSHSFYEPYNVPPVWDFIVTNHILGFKGLGYASMFVSTVIAVERCLCIVFPLRFQTLLKASSMWAILSIGCVIITAGNFVVSEKYRIMCVFDEITMVSQMLPGPSEYYLRNGYIVDLVDGIVYGVFLHTSTVVTVSIATAVTVFTLNKAIVWGKASSSSKQRKERTLTKTLVCLSIQFVVLNLPNMVFKMACVLDRDLSHFGRHQEVYFIFVFVVEVSALTNSCLPFFIYFCTWTKYRQSVMKTFRKVARNRSSTECLDDTERINY